MRSFKDNTGREWSLTITVHEVKVVRETTGVLLTKFFEDNARPYAELLGDVEKLVAVLYCILESCEQTEGVSPKQFARSLGGESLGDAGTALGRAVADFFTNLAQQRAWNTALTKAGQVATALAEKATLAMESVDPSQVASSFTPSALNAQESPELSPGDIPLASSV